MNRSIQGERRKLEPSPEEDKARREEADRKGKFRRKGEYSVYDVRENLLPGPSRKKHFPEYCAALTSRTDLIANDHYDEPMRPVQCYIGYTGDPSGRMRAHQSHGTNSNYLLSVTLAALKDMFPARGFHTEIFLHPIYEREQSIVAEVLFASIRNSFHNTGRGFDIDEPGWSNASGLAMDPEQEGELMDYAQNHTDLETNLHEWTVWVRGEREAVNEEREADRRVERTMAMVDDPEVWLMCRQSVANVAAKMVAEEVTEVLDNAMAAIRAHQERRNHPEADDSEQQS